ncbi:MAG: hypothetical protein KBS60_03935, partial [Phascolarctobacterium sp.]|nr:hypothetical protein [Candidatus Phascolarctobacterium caballi]
TAKVTNQAILGDVQVAGCISVEKVSKAKANLGAAVAVNQVTNNVVALVKGGNYDVASLTDRSMNKLTQVATAVDLGLSFDVKAEIQGAVSVNNLTNNATATVDGATIKAITLDVTAGDIQPDVEFSINPLAGTLESKGFDLQGKEADKAIDSAGKNTDVDVKVNDDGESAVVGYKSKDYRSTNTGNTVVGVAITAPLSLSGDDDSTKYLNAGVGVVVNSVSENFKSEIKGGSNITTKTGTKSGVAVQSRGDTRIVGVGAGFAVTSASEDDGSSDALFSGIGSGVQNNIKNNITALAENSTFTNGSLKVNATDYSHVVGVAGAIDIGGGSRLAAGMSYAGAELSNNTKANALGIIWNGNGSDLTVEGLNNFQLTSVAVDAAYCSSSKEGFSADVHGAIALNKGTNNTEALIGNYKYKDAAGTDQEKKSTISKVKNLTVATNDKSGLTAVAPGLEIHVFDNVSAGFHMAMSKVGTSGTKQVNKAAVEDTTITFCDSKGNMIVHAADESTLKSIAAGGGISGNFAGEDGSTPFTITLSGSVAISDIYKDVAAIVEDSTYKPVLNTQTVQNNVSVLANNKNRIVSTGDSITLGLSQTLAALAGVALARGDIDTTAAIRNTAADGSKLLMTKLNAVEVKAYSDLSMTAVAANCMLGISQNSGSIPASASIPVNVAKHNFANDTVAEIKNMDIESKGILVDAVSKEDVTNVAGGLDLSLSVADQGKAVAGVLGVSVAQNIFSGDTRAEVKGSNLSVENITLKVPDEKGVEKDKQYGLHIAADAGHTYHNVAASGGLLLQFGGQKLLTVDGTGVAACNELKGNTEALLITTDVNKNKDKSTS